MTANRFEDLDEHTGAVMCYTSGTTGRSKGVLYSHRSLVLHSFASALPDVIDLGESSRVLAVVPMFHANAWGLPFTCALVGATQVLPGPHLDPASIIELLESEQVTHGAGVPTIWHALLAHLDAGPRRDLSALRLLLVGGAAIPEATIRAFEQRHGLKVVHAWGMTETAPLGSVSRVPSELDGASEDVATPGGRGRGGQPRSWRCARAARTAALVPWDDHTMGELEVRGHWVAGAYYPGDEAADRWTDDGWFRTGDIVTIGPTGCLSIQDRAKDLVKSGRRVDQHGRPRVAAAGAPGRRRGGRGRRAAPAVGRAAARGRRAETGRHADARGAPRAPRAARREVVAAGWRWCSSRPCRAPGRASTRRTSCARLTRTSTPPCSSNARAASSRPDAGPAGAALRQSRRRLRTSASSSVKSTGFVRW